MLWLNIATYQLHPDAPSQPGSFHLYLKNLLGHLTSFHQWPPGSRYRIFCFASFPSVPVPNLLHFLVHSCRELRVDYLLRSYKRDFVVVISFELVQVVHIAICCYAASTKIIVTQLFHLQMNSYLAQVMYCICILLVY